jgi:hypothetical protein
LRKPRAASSFDTSRNDVHHVQAKFFSTALSLLLRWPLAVGELDLPQERSTPSRVEPNARQAPKEYVMIKTLPVAAFVAVMSLSPAYAAGECTEAHMKQMDGMIAKMTDAAKKKEAMMHLDMSKAEMKKGDEAGCMKHMNQAHKAMGM